MRKLNKAQEKRFNKWFLKVESRMLDAQGMSGGISPDGHEIKQHLAQELSRQKKDIWEEIYTLYIRQHRKRKVWNEIFDGLKRIFDSN